MADDNSLDGALHEAFGGDEGESVVARLHRLSGVRSRILIHDVRGEESPLLRMPGSVDDQGAQDDSRYQIVGEIARGGVGVIYKARDRDLGRDVALKVLRKEHAGRPEVLERLIEEAQIGGQLQHPGIVPVYGMGLQADGRPYLAMKLIKGRTLAAILKTSAGSSSERVRRLRIFEQICQTMAYAHTRGVIHRDLKPANIMVGGFGEVQVVDWGFGKVLGHDDPMAERLKERTIVATGRSRGEGSESLVGSVMGTPAFMPPEQALGQIEELDERADVFALGAILCQVLTGKPPYVGEASDLLTMAAQARLEDAHARLDACDADPALVALCRSALAPMRADRPRNAAEVSEAVESHFAAADERVRLADLRGVREVALLAREQQEAEWARKSKRKTAMLAAVVVLAIALAGAAWMVVDAQQRTRLDDLRVAARNALDQAARSHGAGHFSEAVAKANSARDLAAQDDALATLRDEAQALAKRAASEADRVERRDRLLSALEEAGMAWTNVVGREGTHAAYIAALDDCGLDFRKGNASLLAEEIRADFPESTMEIAAAFDTWSWRTGQELPVVVAREIDPDPWRNRLRDAVESQDAVALEALQAEAMNQDLPPDTFRLLGHALGVSGRPAAAVAFFDELRDKHPGDFAAHMGAMRWSGSSSDAAANAARATAAVALRPKSPSALANLGAALLRTGDLEGAAGASRDAIRLKPDFFVPHNNLGIARFRQGDLDGAIAAYRASIRFQPGYARAHANLGVALCDKGDIDGGIAACREGVRLDPGRAKFHLNLGLVLARNGDDDGALAAYREGIRIQPDLAEARADLADVLRRKGEVDAAIAQCREAIRLQPDLASAHYNLAVLLIDKGDVDGAIVEFGETIQVQPDHSGAHNNLGIALGSKGDFPGAIASFRDAVRAKPGMASAHYNLGNALRRAGDTDGGVAAYREAIRLQPAHGSALTNLGHALRKKGDIDGAIAAYREAIRVRPDLANAHCSLGLELEREARFGEALVSLRKGHELGSRTPGWRFPSAKWVARAERLAGLEARLPKFLEGSDRPKDAAEWESFAWMLVSKKRFVQSAGQYAELLERHPARAADVRYDAACAAVLAETPAWRRRALAWLRAALEPLASDPAAGKRELQHWRRDADLADVRDRIGDLPEDERVAWRQLWVDVDAALRAAEQE